MWSAGNPGTTEKLTCESQPEISYWDLGDILWFSKIQHHRWAYNSSCTRFRIRIQMSRNRNDAKIRVTGHWVPDLPIKGSGKEGGYMIRQKCIILASLWDHAFTSTLQSGEFLPFVALGLLGTLKDRHHLHKSQGVVPPKKQDHTSVLVSTTFKVNRRKFVVTAVPFCCSSFT